MRLWLMSRGILRATVVNRHLPWCRFPKGRGANIWRPCRLRGAITLADSSLLPNTPIALRFPPFCEYCSREGVRLQLNIKGRKIVLHWHCNGCDQEWPVRRREEEPAEESA